MISWLDLVDTVKHENPITKHPRSYHDRHNMTKGLYQLIPGGTEVAVLWLCIPNLQCHFRKSALFEVKST
jgi:hypothetical protein